MIFKTIIGFLMVLMGCSCSQRTSKDQQQTENGSNQHLASKSGLLIENHPNRGLSYTDPEGTKLSYRNIPITITNDSTIAIHIQIALSNEYDYPATYGDQKFKVFLLPKELTPDKVTWDSLSYELGNNELRNFFERELNPPYILNETLEPGEKCDITIGTLYPNPTNCGVVPNALFLQENRGLYNECDRLPTRPGGGNQDVSTNLPLALTLKLNFCKSCTIIPCGYISYPEY